VPQFGSNRFQKLSFDRNVIEKILDRYLSAHGQTRVTNLLDLAPLRKNFGSFKGVGDPRLEGQARDRSDARKGFPSEAQRVNPKQIVFITDLACRVSLKRQRNVIRFDALPIVLDPNELEASCLKFDNDF